MEIKKLMHVRYRLMKEEEDRQQSISMEVKICLSFEIINRIRILCCGAMMETHAWLQLFEEF